MCSPMGGGIDLLEVLTVAPRNSSVGRGEGAFFLTSYGWPLLFSLLARAAGTYTI